MLQEGSTSPDPPPLLPTYAASPFSRHAFTRANKLFKKNGGKKEKSQMWPFKAAVHIDVIILGRGLTIVDCQLLIDLRVEQGSTLPSTILTFALCFLFLAPLNSLSSSICLQVQNSCHNVLEFIIYKINTPL